MSRRYRQSPVFYDPTPARWPWVLALLVVAAIVVGAMLRPDLVPKLVKIVHDAGKALGFQVIMISHHDIAVFEQYADKIFQFVPTTVGAVSVREVGAPARVQDAAT